MTAGQILTGVFLGVFGGVVLPVLGALILNAWDRRFK